MLHTSSSSYLRPTAFRGLSRRAGLAALATGLGLALSGCAAFTPKSPEETVAQRAEERWKLMMADKFEQSYEYTAPSYRALKEYKAYRLGYGPASAWLDAKVVKVTCASEENCNAVLEVTVKNLTPIRSTANLTTALDETWVREGGRWYVLPAL